MCIESYILYTKCNTTNVCTKHWNTGWFRGKGQFFWGGDSKFWMITEIELFESTNIMRDFWGSNCGTDDYSTYLKYDAV